MKHIAVVGMPAAGHVHPTLPLLHELVRRGARVTCWATEPFRRGIERSGAAFLAYPAGSITADGISAATRSGSSVRVVTHLLRATVRIVPALLDELRAEPPDVVAYDANALWGRVAAAQLDRPQVSLMTTILVGRDGLRELTAREWLRFLRLSLPDLPGALAARRQVVRRFGRDVVPPSPALPMRGDLTVFPVPRWLQPPDPRIDDGCLFVGPTIDAGARTGSMDAELAAILDGRRPVVLVSLGTLHDGGEAFLRLCREALADVPARVVVVAPRSPVASGDHGRRAGEPEGQLLVRPWVPQLDVLSRAGAFVTHGGMNGVLEGLAYGVPLVVVPQQVEQLIIGRRVAARGAALVLPDNVAGRPLSPDRLRSAVVRALTQPSLRASARTLATSLGEGGGAGAAADAIERVASAAAVRP